MHKYPKKMTWSDEIFREKKFKLIPTDKMMHEEKRASISIIGVTDMERLTFCPSEEDSAKYSVRTLS